MTYAETLEAIKILGFPAAIALLFIFQNKKLNEFIQNNYNRMVELIGNIGKGNLTAKQAEAIFSVIMTNHINQKIDLVKKILIANSIDTRRCQIEKNIKAEFMRITQDEITILRELNITIFAGFLSELCWEQFLPECFDIIFSKDAKEKKLIDLRSMMNGYVTEMINRYESNFKAGYTE